jgi:hypothetical protein
MFSRFILALMPLTSFAETTLEPLMGHLSSYSGVHIQMRSGGCTWKRDIQVVHHFEHGIHQLSFVRMTDDQCLAYLPYGKVISYSFSDLGLNHGDRFEILNPTMQGQVSDL